MSSGVFTRAKYTTDAGTIVPIRVQPETLAATLGGTANATAAGAVTPGYPKATVSKSRRAYGIHARTVTLAFIGTPPDGYAPNQTLTIPVMSLTVWQGLSEGVACTYLAKTAEVVSVNPEKIR